MSNRNATASWHGYSHQSKVGVLVALRKINELLIKKEPIDDWKIEYESAEDFDIKKGDVVDSRHQVKAYKKGNYPNAYEDVLANRYPVVNNERTIADKGFKYRVEYKDGTIGDIEVDKNSRYLHTIVNVQGFYLSKDKFKRKMHANAKYVENPNDIQLYQYSNNKTYCDLSEYNGNQILNNYCLKEIKDILKNNDLHLKVVEESHKTIFWVILDKLEDEITKNHLKSSTGSPTLPLEEIYNTVISLETEKRTNLQKGRAILLGIWSDYFSNLDNQSNQLTKNQLDNVNSAILNIARLNDNKFEEFIMHLNPDQVHIKGFSDFQSLSALIQIDSLKDILYNCLYNIIRQHFDIDYLGYKKGKYTITLINRASSSIREVIRMLEKNNDYLQKIYERKYLINGQINNSEITNKITEVRSNNNSNWSEEKHEDITHIMNKEMQFITADEAINKINGG